MASDIDQPLITSLFSDRDTLGLDWGGSKRRLVIPWPLSNDKFGVCVAGWVQRVAWGEWIWDTLWAKTWTYSDGASIG